MVGRYRSLGSEGMQVPILNLPRPAVNRAKLGSGSGSVFDCLQDPDPEYGPPESRSLKNIKNV